MSDFNDFKPAFPLPMSFKIQDGKYGMQLGIFIPTESITPKLEGNENQEFWEIISRIKENIEKNIDSMGYEEMIQLLQSSSSHDHHTDLFDKYLIHTYIIEKTRLLDQGNYKCHIHDKLRYIMSTLYNKDNSLHIFLTGNQLVTQLDELIKTNPEISQELFLSNNNNSSQILKISERLVDIIENHAKKKKRRRTSPHSKSPVQPSKTLSPVSLTKSREVDEIFRNNVGTVSLPKFNPVKM